MLGQLSAIALLAVAIVTVTQPAHAERPTDAAVHQAEADGVAALLQQLKHGSFAMIDEAGRSLGQRPQGSVAPVVIAEQDVVRTLRGARLDPGHAASLWEFFAETEHAAFATLPIVEALIFASNTPKTREAFWSELAGLVRAPAGKDRPDKRDRSLLAVLERHRAVLLPLIGPLRDTESSGDDMVELMLSSRVLGADFSESLDWATDHNPAAVARRIERDRGRGRPVRWEEQAFQRLLWWKDTRFLAGVAKAPRSLAELDAAGETFVSIFNCLHDFDEKYRKAMLRGLSPVEVFHAVVGGETELYRMGTSSYRDFLHAIVMRGIKEAGSLEAFLERTIATTLGEAGVRGAARRGMILLRVVSSFGLLEELLATVRDRDRFIGEAIASLGEPEAFEGNGSVVMDMLTARSGSPAALEFRKALLERLYATYLQEPSPKLRSVYGSMLSVYQTVTGDRRDASIDRDYPLDRTITRVPFGRLFSDDGRGGTVHRMFMRMDQDVDAVTTYAGFRALMRSRGASIREEQHFDLFRFWSRGRTIEIYANKPTALGLKRGIDDIAAALRGKRVETVIGRGHSSIVKPLQESSRRILGDQIKDVAAVLVGTCGGDASVRDLIGTFGYVSFFTTRSTGRQHINNALIETYVTALMAMRPDDSMHLGEVLDRATTRYLKAGGDSELRDDASFYRVSTTAVLTALLFDTHVHRHAQSDLQAAQR